MVHYAGTVNYNLTGYWLEKNKILWINDWSLIINKVAGEEQGPPQRLSSGCHEECPQPNASHCLQGDFYTNVLLLNVFIKWIFFFDFSLLKDLAGHAVEAEQEPGKKKKGGGKTVDILFKKFLEIFGFFGKSTPI